MEPIIFSLLADDLIRVILNHLDKRKKAKFKEIRHVLIHETDEQADTKKVQEKLNQLKERNLVGVVSSSVKDFDSYYLTPEGLKTVRAFNQALTTAG